MPFESVFMSSEPVFLGLSGQFIFGLISGVGILGLIVLFILLAKWSYSSKSKSTTKILFSPTRPSVATRRIPTTEPNREVQANGASVIVEDCHETVRFLTSESGPVSEPVETSQTEETNDDEDENSFSGETFNERVQSRVNAGEELSAVLADMMKPMDDDTFDECLEFLAGDTRHYPVEVVAAAVAVEDPAIDDVAEILNRKHTLTEKEWITALFPLSREESVQAKAKQLIEAVKKTLNISWDDNDVGNFEPYNCVEPLTANGLSIEDVIALFHDQSDMCLGEILNISTIPQPAIPTIAVLVKTCEIDLCDNDNNDEYLKLRENNVDLEQVAHIFRLCDIDAEDAIACVNAETEQAENPEDIILAFLKAGYPLIEVLQGLLNILEDTNWGQFANIMDEAKITVEDMATFFRTEKTDPEELEEQLIAEEDFDIEYRVQLLHALLFPKEVKPKPATKQPATAPEPS